MSGGAQLRAKSPGHFFDEVDNRDLVMYPMTPMGLPSSGPNAGSHCYPHAAQYSHLSPEAQTPPQVCWSGPAPDWGHSRGLTNWLGTTPIAFGWLPDIAFTESGLHCAQD